MRDNLNDLELYKKAAAASKRHPGRETKCELISDPAEAKKMSRITSALAINKTPSGSWHPHRGTTQLLRLAIESKNADCAFYSWTPVESIAKDGNGWKVDCGKRGAIEAGQVVLATNAWTGHMFEKGSPLASQWVQDRIRLC